uniref:Peptidase M14 domain-containing protein n=1 Tax=Scylla olivacea TaxID=85551 RepID=A0A0P4VSV2_SCYOL
MRVVRDEIIRLGSKIKVYLTFHSYSQLWMYPWGYTSALPDDWKDLDNLAQDAVSALTAVHGTKYEIGSSTNTICKSFFFFTFLSIRELYQKLRHFIFFEQDPVEVIVGFYGVVTL